MVLILTLMDLYLGIRQRPPKSIPSIKLGLLGKEIFLLKRKIFKHKYQTT